MILNSRNNAYDFRFPRKFIPEEVANKYKKYLNRVPGGLLAEPIDFVNYSIQGLNIPGVTFDPVTQSDNDGTIRSHRGAQPIQNTISREFTVTFQLLDGFINYWLMMDTLLYYYARSTKQAFIEPLTLRILDAEGASVAYMEYSGIIMTSINELNLNMAENVSDFATFECSFVYNKLNLRLEIE
jgi:hypothetical protein|tara:strand:- start:940 stop:1491 length:552 start_codon:yes stop_codon:yes gene_type:complete